ncbi:fibronectin type III domain-containing protein [Bacillus pumilus]|uniref:fibronectin type III domain-containing protein n=1 Tax=Bacillus pumilus TaxID=1408 RepID=UPI0039FBDFE3
MKKYLVLSLFTLSFLVSFLFAPDASAQQEQLNKSFDVYTAGSSSKRPESPFAMNFVERTYKLTSLTDPYDRYPVRGYWMAFVSTLDEPAYIDSIAYSGGGSTSRFSMAFYDSNKTLIGESDGLSGKVSYSPPLKPVKYVTYFWKGDGSYSSTLAYLKATGDYIGVIPSVSDVKIDVTPKSADVSFKFPENHDESKPYFVKVYLDDNLLYDSVTGSKFSLKDLKPETDYTLKLSVSDGDRVSALSVYNFKTESLPKPKDVSNVNIETTDSKATISYTLPQEYDHLKLYKDNVIVNSDIKANSFEITGLIPSMKYDYKLYAFSKDGVRSDGYDLSFKTADKPDAPPPKAPKGLDVKGGNAALFVKWNANEEKDVIAYNLFLNGKKITTLKGTSYTLSDLENDVSYNISVQAVNSSSKTSELTSKTGTPYEKGMPSFKNGYKLKDVGDGVTSWFSSLWLILAFAIGIPLAFYISHRVKALFFT